MIKQKNLRGQAFAAASESKQIAHRERTNTTWKTLIERSGTTPQVPWNYDEKSDTATQCQRLQRTKAYYGAFMDMTADFVDCNSNELEARMAEWYGLDATFQGILQRIVCRLSNSKIDHTRREEQNPIIKKLLPPALKFAAGGKKADRKTAVSAIFDVAKEIRHSHAKHLTSILGEDGAQFIPRYSAAYPLLQHHLVPLSDPRVHESLLRELYKLRQSSCNSSAAANVPSSQSLNAKI
jgi:hypothetical protein